MRKHILFSKICQKGTDMKETDAMITLKGIGEKTEKLFQKAGIYTVGDLLRFYPRGYEVYEAPVPISEIEEGNVFAVTGMISGAVKTGGSRAMQVTTLCIKDESASLKVIWFRMPFLKNSLRSGMTVTVRGRVVRKKDGLVMEHPEIFSPFSKYEEKLGTLQPVYPLTAGLTNNMVTRAMKQALDEIVLAREFLPKELRLHYRLAEYNYALRGIHFPIDKQNYYTARERLVFEEFFMFILALRQLKESTDKMENAFLVEKREEIEHLIAKLPYELTNAQKKVWTEIKKELIIQSFDSGLYTIPPFIYVAGKDTFASNALALKVMPVAVDSMATIHDYAGVAQPNTRIWDYLPDFIVDYWWIFLIVILVAAGVFVWWRYFRGKKAMPLVPKKKPVPPYEYAMQELNRLKAEKLCESGQEKEYYTRLTEILRVYLDKRFGINAMEMTSTQIMQQIRSNEDTRTSAPVMKQILEMADFVKFAKVRPLPDDNQKAFNNAVTFVEDTKPVEQPAAENEQTQPKVTQ